MAIQVTFSVKTPEEAVELLQKFAGSTPTLGATDSTSTEPSGVAGAETVASSDPSATPTAVPNELLVSDAVRQYAEENNVDLTTVEGTGKNGRIVKKDVTEAIPPAEPEADNFDFDEDAATTPETTDFEDDFDFSDDSATEDEPLTRDDVREALRTFQAAAKQKLLNDGVAEPEAKERAMNVAKKLLLQVGGAENLGALAEAKYSAVITKATEAKAKL